MLEESGCNDRRPWTSLCSLPSDICCTDPSEHSLLGWKTTSALELELRWLEWAVALLLTPVQVCVCNEILSPLGLGHRASQWVLGPADLPCQV